MAAGRVSATSYLRQRIVFEREMFVREMWNKRKNIDIQKALATTVRAPFSLLLLL